MSDCILWHRCIDANGYGRNRGRYAHRVAWEECFGPIPPRHDVHHECGMKACINPEHLRLLAHGEHTVLHAPATAYHERCRAATHCKRGHEMTPENTYRYPSDGRRLCRTCNAASTRRSAERRKAA